MQSNLVDSTNVLEESSTLNMVAAGSSDEILTFTIMRTSYLIITDVCLSIKCYINIFVKQGQWYQIHNHPYHYQVMRGADKITSYRIGKMYLHIPPELHKLMTSLFFNFFNPSKKNSFGCAANRKIGNRNSQRLINTPTYISVCIFVILQVVFLVFPNYIFPSICMLTLCNIIVSYLVIMYL
jgi:hypothetical protein